MYIEKQGGNWILSILAIAVIVMAIVYTFSTEDSMDAIVAVSTFTVISIIVALMFFRLKTEVMDDEVVLTFGIGPVKKRIATNQIKEVSIVRNKWYFGWGIRYYGKGWLWNIWGLDGVELTLKDKKSKFRIGTQEPQKLHDEISKRLTN